MEGSKLLFSLDCREEGPTALFSKDKPETESDDAAGMDLTLNHGRGSHAPSLSHSPSSPGSLADMCSTCEPLTANLVKSSSSDLEPKEDAPLKGKPPLSRVKSLSTEISRRVEHDENLSKSDSKLHLYPQQKIAQARPEEVELLRENDRSSVGPLSPIESKGASLIAELEDTRRKFSEAMQDPLSMFSKMIGDESPKQGRPVSVGDSSVSYVSDLKCRKRTDSEHKGVLDSHLGKFRKKSSVKSSVTPEHQLYDTAEQNETCSSNVVMQVLEDRARSQETKCRSRNYYQNMLPGPSLPLFWLLPVGLMAYGFLVLPLPSYVTGLSLGVLCGFLLGLVVVYMFAPRQTNIRRNRRRNNNNNNNGNKKQSEESIIEGWMNETYCYDAETFHPSATHSVHVSLKGNHLHLSLPNANIRRWASINETPSEPAAFVHSREYQLMHCKVSLLPSCLARKRTWNKKYPICVVLDGGESDGPEEGKGGADKPVTLYLFGRTGREKEEWFQRFVSASEPEEASSDRDQASSTCIGEGGQDIGEELVDLTEAVKTRTLVDYSTYMAQLIESEGYEATPSPVVKEGSVTNKNSEIPIKDSTCGVQPGAETGADSGALGGSAEGQPHWVNALVGRIFLDFLREKYWTDQVAHKIQKKLSKIKLPYFMNELKLADLDMGTCLPQVISTSKPALDHRGLWLEMDVTYTGGLKMSLETKMNLCKLGKDDEVQTESLQESLPFGSKPRLSVLADSDEESSSAGSSEEEDVFEPLHHTAPREKSPVVVADGSGNSTSRKILRFVDKIAKSKYFQKATENEYIKKKIAEVSNMPLMLSVEVQELSGTLAINIPPPPTDRIWYSFRVPPRLDLHVRPMLGEREVTFTHVTEWIEKKLQCEFQKVFVMPNMDDLYLPLMTSSLESTAASQHSSVALSHQSSVESQEYLSE